MPAWARWLAAIAGVAAVSWGLSGIAPRVPVPPALGAIVAFACVCASTLIVSVLSPAWKLRTIAWLLVPAVALGAVAWMGASGAGAAAVVIASLLGAGSITGGAIGARIQHPSHLLVAAYASSLADLFSVLSPRGVTAQVIESERWLPLVVMSWPVLGTDAIEPMLGVGDVVMCALYTVAARELGLPFHRTVIALSLAFAAVLVALVVLAAPLPALPFLGAAIVIAHPATRSFRAGERRTAALGLGILTLAFAAAWLL